MELIDSEDQYTYAAWSLPLRITGSVGHFGVLLPLGLFGCIWHWSDRRRFWPLYCMLAVYAASVVAFYVFGRYRYPLVPLLIPFAGAGLTVLINHIRNGTGRALVVGAWIILRDGSNTSVETQQYNYVKRKDLPNRRYAPYVVLVPAKPEK